MAHTKVILFILILLPILISNGRTISTELASTYQAETSGGTDAVTEVLIQTEIHVSPMVTTETWTNVATEMDATTKTDSTTETDPTMETGSTTRIDSTMETGSTTRTDPTAQTNTATSTRFIQTSFIRVSIVTNSGEEDAFFDLTNFDDLLIAQQMLANLSTISPPDWPHLGFRGYGLKSQGIPHFPLYVRVFKGVIQIFDNLDYHFYRDAYGLENFLSQKSNSAGSQSTNNLILAKTDDKTPAKALPTSGSEPPYEPEKWNKATVITKNNCYAYATNIMGDSFPRPGTAGNKNPPFRNQPGYNCIAFVAAAESDGLVKIDCDKACPKESFKVALVIKPTQPKDYHWYRQDNDGNWSHKSGTDPATNLDEKKKKITDPRTADRGEYTDFCGCFCVHPKKVKIRDVSSQMYVF